MHHLHITQCAPSFPEKLRTLVTTNTQTPRHKPQQETGQQAQPQKAGRQGQARPVSAVTSQDIWPSGLMTKEDQGKSARSNCQTGWCTRGNLEAIQREEST